jgi:kinesin family member 21
LSRFVSILTVFQVLSRASNIQLYNEEIIDLLADVRTASAVRNAAIKIQEDPVHNEIYLRGAVWRPVQSSEDIMNALRAGALNRTTAATNMNQQSSRSHAIFTVQLMQQRVVTSEVMDSEVSFKHICLNSANN